MVVRLISDKEFAEAIVISDQEFAEMDLIAGDAVSPLAGAAPRARWCGHVARRVPCEGELFAPGEGL